MVLLSHEGETLPSGYPWWLYPVGVFGNGGNGVEFFFILSGYLITTLLRQEFAKTESISLRRFYLRRVYRILPPMYIVLAILILLAWAEVVPSNMELGAVAAKFVQVTNYYLILHGPSHLVPFTIPMWSLAIEEHFYLIFPVAFAFLLRHYDYRRVRSGRAVHDLDD